MCLIGRYILCEIFENYLYIVLSQNSAKFNVGIEFDDYVEEEVLGAGHHFKGRMRAKTTEIIEKLGAVLFQIQTGNS